MKLQLDTEKKTIKIEELVNLKDLVDLLEKLLPEGEWKNYSLESTIITNWNSPIYIRDWWSTPCTPYITTPVRFNSGISGLNIKYDTNDSITKSLFNIEC